MNKNINEKTIDLYNLPLELQADILDVFQISMQIESIEFCVGENIEKDMYTFVQDGKPLKVTVNSESRDVPRKDCWGLNSRSIFKLPRENTFDYIPRETYCGE